MLERIKEHIKEREAINKELLKVIKHCSPDEDSPIQIFEGDWMLNGFELLIQHSDDPIEEDGYPYVVSSLGAKGEELFMGEKDGYTYLMAYPDGEDWDNTTIFVLDNKNKVDK